MEIWPISKRVREQLDAAGFTEAKSMLRMTWMKQRFEFKDAKAKLMYGVLGQIDHSL